ncbi:hypothetical protein AB6A40_010630, partial [Gnathostoma spinigerum]
KEKTIRLLNATATFVPGCIFVLMSSVYLAGTIAFYRLIPSLEWCNSFHSSECCSRFATTFSAVFFSVLYPFASLFILQSVVSKLIAQLPSRVERS